MAGVLKPPPRRSHGLARSVVLISKAPAFAGSFAVVFKVSAQRLFEPYCEVVQGTCALGKVFGFLSAGSCGDFGVLYHVDVPLMFFLACFIKCIEFSIKRIVGLKFASKVGFNNIVNNACDRVVELERGLSVSSKYLLIGWIGLSAELRTRR